MMHCILPQIKMMSAYKSQIEVLQVQELECIKKAEEALDMTLRDFYLSKVAELEHLQGIVYLSKVFANAARQLNPKNQDSVAWRN